MPDPSVEAAAAPTPPPAVPPTPAVQPPPPADPGHVSDADFNDPTWGLKLKNLHNGLQEKSKAAAESERKLRDIELQWAQVQTVLKNPTVAAAVRYAVQGHAPQEEETPEQKLRREMREEILGEVRSDLAMRDAVHEAGAGDVTKGSAFMEEHGQDILAKLNIMNGTDPRARLALALLAVKYEKGLLNGKPTVTPPPPGTVQTEGGRAGGGSPADAAPAEIKTVEDMFKAAGVTPAEYLRDVGVI